MSVEQMAAQLAQEATQQVQEQQEPEQSLQSQEQEEPENKGLFDDILDDETAEEEQPEAAPVEEVDELAEVAKAMKDEDKPPFKGKIDGFDLKLPKGLSEDNALLKGFTKIASEHKADPALVQKALDLVVEHEQNYYKILEERDIDFRRDLNNQFIRQNKADPEFGGPNYDASVSYAMKALRKFTPKEELLATSAEDGKMGMLEYLRLSNSHNATPLWKFLVRVGKTLSESQAIIPGAGGAPNNTPKDPADIMFDDLK